LKDDGELNGKYFCGFVADRGANKGKYCCTMLTEEHKNCGSYDGDTWVPHSPEKEFEEVGVGHNMRCKKCWAKNKDGHSRKTGAYDKLYKTSVEDTNDSNVEDLPEIPELPDANVIEAPVDVADVEVNAGGDDYENATDDEDDEDNVEDDGGDDVTTEDTDALLDGLL